jgi:hypothetical protein
MRTAIPENGQDFGGGGQYHPTCKKLLVLLSFIDRPVASIKSRAFSIPHYSRPFRWQYWRSMQILCFLVFWEKSQKMMWNLRWRIDFNELAVYGRNT